MELRTKIQAAQSDSKQKVAYLQNMVFGILDCAAVLRSVKNEKASSLTPSFVIEWFYSIY